MGARPVHSPPKRQVQHYVPRWLQKGFCDPYGNLFAFRLNVGTPFKTGPSGLYAKKNLNTVWSEDGDNCLADSERAYEYVDTGAASALRVIRNAAREADWSAAAVGVSGLTTHAISWIEGAVLMQLQRTVTRHEAWQRVAEEHGLSRTQLRVAQVASVARKPAKVTALLKAWAPIIGRSQPQHPFILGDDIVVVPLPIGREATEEVPFVGIPVDQHTLIGFTGPECQLFHGEPGKAEVVRMPGLAVDRVCEGIAQRANIVAASSAVRAARFGMPEYERRHRESDQ